MASEALNVITLVHGREAQLDNLLLGLERGTAQPAAVWVVFMNQAARVLSSDRFPIHCVELHGEGPGLPLAAARNAVRQCQGEQWVFLDVDCIPGADLLEGYAQALAQYPDALHSGEVRYLPEQAETVHWTQATLNRQSVAHPLSQYRGEPGSMLPHPLFWSLNFACSRAVFERIGGFDEGYSGYGAEDTDFAFAACAQGVELRVAAASAFHQYHPTWRPPLNHFHAIIGNAQRFHSRWSVWPMDGWLREFVELGLLDWSQAGLQVLREPTPEEVARCFDESRTGY